MTPEAYITQMRPYGSAAAAGTGLPVALVLSQWAHETGWGESELARGANNHGGIKYTEHADYAAGAFSGYNSLSNFAKDYVRVISLSYYDRLRQAAAAGTPPADLAGMFGPYAEDPAYGDKLRGVLAVVQEAGGAVHGPWESAPPVTVVQTGPDTLQVVSAGTIAKAAIPVVLLAAAAAVLLSGE